MVVWDSSMSMSISELRSDEYADKVLSPAYLRSNAFVMNKCKSFRKILKSKAPKADPCVAPKISSKKVLIYNACIFSNLEIMEYAVKDFRKMK